MQILLGANASRPPQNTQAKEDVKMEKRINVVFSLCPPQMLRDPGGDLKEKGIIHIIQKRLLDFGTNPMSSENDKDVFDYPVWIDCSDLIWDTCACKMYSVDDMMRKMEEALNKMEPFLKSLLIYRDVKVKLCVSGFKPIEGLVYGFCSLFDYELRAWEDDRTAQEEYKSFSEYAKTNLAKTQWFNLFKKNGRCFEVEYASILELIALYQESEKERQERIKKEEEARRKLEQAIEEENERRRKVAEWENDKQRNHWVIGACIVGLVVLTVVAAPVAVAAGAITAATATSIATAAATTTAVATALDVGLHVYETVREEFDPDLYNDVEGHGKAVLTDGVFLLLNWERVVSILRLEPALTVAKAKTLPTLNKVGVYTARFKGYINAARNSGPIILERLQESLSVMKKTAEAQRESLRTQITNLCGKGVNAEKVSQAYIEGRISPQMSLKRVKQNGGGSLKRRDDVKSLIDLGKKIRETDTAIAMKEAEIIDFKNSFISLGDIVSGIPKAYNLSMEWAGNAITVDGFTNGYKLTSYEKLQSSVSSPRRIHISG